MRSVILIVMAALFSLNLSSCVENSSKYKALEAKLDSLQVSHRMQGAELDELFATINSIEQGLSSIRETENTGFLLLHATPRRILSLEY